MSSYPRVPYQAYALSPQRSGSVQLTVQRGRGLPDFVMAQNRFLGAARIAATDFVTLVYDGCQITVEGTHLERLPELTDTQGLRFVQCFDPRRHLPPEPDMPVIHYLEWVAIPKVDGVSVSPRMLTHRIQLAHLIYTRP